VALAWCKRDSSFSRSISFGSAMTSHSFVPLAAAKCVGPPKLDLRLFTAWKHFREQYARVRASWSFTEISTSAGLKVAYSVWEPRRRRRLRCCPKTRAGGRCLVRVELGKGRCCFHGGLSTGPKTEAGRARIAEAQRRRWRALAKKHEKYALTLNASYCVYRKPYPH
jgi:hypothetical protein